MLVLSFGVLKLTLIFQISSFRDTIRMSKSLDPDQAGLSVETDLGPNCLQRLSTEEGGRLEIGKKSQPIRNLEKEESSFPAKHPF